MVEGFWSAVSSRQNNDVFFATLRWTSFFFFFFFVEAKTDFFWCFLPPLLRTPTTLHKK